jgi:predicted dehydrogenase
VTYSAKMSGTTLRIGIVGAGGIVKARHLPALRRRDDVEIRAVSNASRASAEKVAAGYGIPVIHEHWPELVSRDDLDIIWIGTPPALHAPVTIAALESGKHVFCQARMASTVEEARQMLAASRAHPELVSMLCPPPHGMKHGSYFKKLLDDRFAGEMLHFHLQAHSDIWTHPENPRHYRQDVEQSGINALSVGIYLEVLDRWIGQPRQLSAQVRVAASAQRGEPVEVPDIVQVIGQWANDLMGTLEWSGVAHHPAPEQLTIYGREGTLAYRFDDDTILGARRGEPELRALSVPREFVRDWRVEDEFIAGVLDGGRPQPSFDVGLRYMLAVDAIRRSARGVEWTSLAHAGDDLGCGTVA